jgi:Flp pilus assembly protein TadD
MLVPVIGLMQVGAQAMADRYTYLPQIGIGILVAWGVADVSQTWPHRRWICGAASAAIFAMLMGIAWQQTFYWRDSETLWTRSVACSPQNAFALRSRGITLQQAGRIDEAIADYETALAIRPDGVVYNNLGIILASRGKLDEAFAYFQKAVQLAPDCADAHQNLGRILADRGRPDEAILHFRKAVQIEPNNPVFRQRLGNALHRQDK